MPASPDRSPHSPARLILLPDTDDSDPLQSYSSDDGDDSDDNDLLPATNQLPVPPLPPSLVFLYLLSPYLRLGAIYASDIGGAPLIYGLAGLAVAASLSAFCRQIWFLLGRYLRQSSAEDILIHMFARRHRRVRKYGLARHTLAIISASFRLLLAAMYLRDSVDTALLLQVPNSFSLLRSRLIVAISLSVLVFVLSLPRSLAAKSVVYATSLSVASYLAWLVAASFSQGENKLRSSTLSSFQRGLLWNEISSLTFACATTMTVPLTASLMAGTPAVSLSPRNARMRSFELLNISSTTLAALLVLPLVITAVPPHASASAATPDNLVLILRITTLILSAPSVVISIISLPLHGVAYRFIRTNMALSIITLTMLALSLVPPAVASTLDDVTLILAVLGTYLLPAFAHVIIHYFRRPLSIIVSHEPSSAPSSPLLSDSESPSSPSRDPLLQRKERLLQRSRFGKRLLWDVVVWIILIPTCGFAFVWASGRLARQW